MPETLLIPIYRVCGLLLLPVLLIAYISWEMAPTSIGGEK